jgi:hypothetical protein
VIKFGKRSRAQLYKCKECGRRFSGGNRCDKSQVITDYVEGKQTINQIADKYGVSSKTISRDLKGMRYVQKILKDKEVTIQMDTTCWGRNFELMVIKDELRNIILWRKHVTYETIADYIEGVRWLKSRGFRIYGAVIDGMQGLAQALPVLVQLCQFHQMLMVRLYLTQEPELDASRELLELVNNITSMDKESFSGRSVNGMAGTKTLSTSVSTTDGQEEYTALHAPQTAECIFEYQTQHAAAVDFP